MQLPWRSLPQPPFARTVRAPRRPSATLALLALLALGAFAQWVLCRIDAPADPFLAGNELTARGLAEGRWWTPLTQLFVWTGPAWLWPLAFLTLAAAGRPLERTLGRRHLGPLFALTGLAGGLGQLGFGALLHRQSEPVAGPAPAALGFLLALACIEPKRPLLPWRGLDGLRRIKVLHCALGALAGTALAGTRSPAAGVLVGGLSGCLYVHALGFARRNPQENAAPATAPAPVSAASSASWPPGQPAEPAPAPSLPVLATAPATTTAREVLAVPRLTERERRMTPREFIAEKVDPILEKISRDGMGSLTAEERQLLEKAREKMAGGR